MNERTEARAMFLAAIAFALFGAFAPYRWHDMPSLITNLALVLALFFLIWAALISLPSPAKGTKKTVSAALIAVGISALIMGIVLYLDPSPGQKDSDIREIPLDQLIKESMEQVEKMRAMQIRLNHNMLETGRVKNEVDFKEARKHQDDLIDEFATVRPRARILLIEILRRQGIYPPYDLRIVQQGYSLLTDSFAGPSPIGDAANFLEYYTMRLPR
jgi:hypothetical protein